MSSNQVTAKQSVATNLKVDASGVAVPVTDNGGSLTVDGAVTVSGTVTATGPLTDTQLRATAVPVSLASAPTTAITAAALPLPAGAATSALQAGGLPAALGAGGGLKVDGSGTALPVSSATLATVAKQPALGTAGSASADVITVQGVASMTKLLVTPDLPSGAATAAKQPALGTAGTASADVITVQGVASGVPLFGGLRGINISQTPTVTNGAYAAEDVIGGLLTFANAARTSAGSGLITGITVMCKSPLTLATVPTLELAFFNQTFTNIADNGVWGPSDADMANCIGTIPVAAWNVTSTNCIATRFNVGFMFTLTGTSLFAQLITHTAVTLTSTSDIIVGLEVAYLD